MKKKSSLSLSVNAIVVLIIAITMLGLGLGFVKTMFGSAAEKFTGVIAEEQNPPIPSASNPVSLSRGVVITNPGGDQGIKISLFNPTNGNWDSVQPSITCTPTAFTSTINAKKILQGKYVTFGALIKIPGTALEETTLCGVTFENTPTGGDEVSLDYSADFTIRVQSG